MLFKKDFFTLQVIHKLLFSQILAYCGKSTTNEGCYEKNHIGYGSQSPVYWTCTRIRRPNSHRLAARIIATTLSPLRVRFFVKSHGIIKDFSSTRCRKIRVKYVVFSYIFHPCKNYVLYWNFYLLVSLLKKKAQIKKIV